jgi:DNA-binding transcriptional LysR family regulator
MDINTLKAFVAVAETSSFSLAAERIYLTQSAVSKRIAGLEGELGVKLFDRLGKTTSLNEAGRKLLPRAINMLQEMEDIQRSISNLSGDVGGTLKMGTSHHIGLHRLPPVLRRFRQEHPEVQLDIRFMGSEAACHAVAQGKLELGIVTLPTEIPPNLNTAPIWSDPLNLVVSHDHPLAQMKHPTLEELVKHPALLPGIGTYTRNILEQALAPQDLKIEVAISTNYLETLKVMASTGLGWSLLPGMMTTGGDLHIIRIPGLHLHRNLGAVTHSSRTLSNAASAMLGLCASSQGS